MAEKPEPVKVLYCAVCSLPPEYCEFGPDFQKCKPWLRLNAPDLYPDLLKESSEADAGEASDQLQSLKISGADGAAPASASGSDVPETAIYFIEAEAAPSGSLISSYDEIYEDTVD